MAQKTFKIIVLAFFVILIGANCNAQLLEYEQSELITGFDEYKKQNTLLLILNCLSDEANQGLFVKKPKYSISANFYKEQLIDSNYTCLVILKLENIFYDLDSVVYFNINNNIYKLPVTNIKKIFTTEIGSRSTGVGVDAHVSSIGSDNILFYTCKVIIPCQYLKQALPINKFVIRMYSNYQPATFIFNSFDISLTNNYVNNN